MVRSADAAFVLRAHFFQTLVPGILHSRSSKPGTGAGAEKGLVVGSRSEAPRLKRFSYGPSLWACCVPWPLLCTIVICAGYTVEARTLEYERPLILQAKSNNHPRPTSQLFGVYCRYGLLMVTDQRQLCCGVPFRRFAACELWSKHFRCSSVALQYRPYIIPLTGFSEPAPLVRLVLTVAGNYGLLAIDYGLLCVMCCFLT